VGEDTWPIVLGLIGLILTGISILITMMVYGTKTGHWFGKLTERVTGVESKVGDMATKFETHSGYVQDTRVAVASLEKENSQAHKGLADRLDGQGEDIRRLEGRCDRRNAPNSTKGG